MNRSVSISLVSFCLCAAACAADEGAAPLDEGMQEEDVSAPDGESGYSDDEADPGEEPYTLADPEAALAAIPDDMRPAELLDSLKSQLLVPDIAGGGRAMFTDIVTLQPGDDVTFCTYIGSATDEVMYLHDTLGRQTQYGHHAIMQYTLKPKEPGTRPCAEIDDLDDQPGQILGGTGGEGTSGLVLPSNVVTEIPAGAQLVINHHWIHTGDEPVDVQAEMITIPPTSDQELVIARALAIVITDFEIGPGEHGTASGECVFDKDVQLITMLGHEHQWGTHVRAERMGAEPEMIFDHDYDPEMISQPLAKHYPIDAPLRFAAGDAVRMTCDWQNTSDVALTFPREMCVLFGWQIGAEKDATCYGGAWL